MKIKPNGVYKYNGKLVKVIKPQGFRAVIREPKGVSYGARTDLLRRTSHTLEDFRVRD